MSALSQGYKNTEKPPSKREVPSECEAEGVIPPSLRATPLKAYGVKGASTPSVTFGDSSL